MGKKIIKHGKYYIGKINYKCSKCSCKFTSDPDYVDFIFDNGDMYYNSTCPECGHTVTVHMLRKNIESIREYLKRKGVL